MRLHRARLHAFALLCVAAVQAATAQNDSDTPLGANYVAATDRLHTAGQPDEETLASLGDRGFELVVNLAPPTSDGAIADEGKLVAEQGPVYVNIPVDWRRPTYDDFELFSAVMNGARDRKVLVHCQANMRASAFTFLYRVVHERVPPANAFAAVQPVWIPRDQWAEFIALVLDRHGIEFPLPAAK